MNGEPKGPPTSNPLRAEHYATDREWAIALTAEIERLARVLDIERGACLTRGQALTRALRCFDELLDNVWPDGLPSTVDAVVEQMRRALENGKCPSDETSDEPPIAEMRHTAAGPELWVCGVKVAEALGVTHDTRFIRLAELVNAAHSSKNGEESQ